MLSCADGGLTQTAPACTVQRQRPAGPYKLALDRVIFADMQGASAKGKCKGQDVPKRVGKNGNRNAGLAVVAG